MLHKRERFRRKCYSYITHCMSACKRFAAQFSSMLHLLNATSPHGLSQRFLFLKCCTRENAFDASVIVISHTACLPAKGLQRNSHQCYISSMLHLLTDSVSVFIILKCCTRENAFDTSHTLHVCLQKVCSAILINATSPQCYISSMLHLLTDSVSVFIF